MCMMEKYLFFSLSIFIGIMLSKNVKTEFYISPIYVVTYRFIFKTITLETCLQIIFCYILKVILNCFDQFEYLK